MAFCRWIFVVTYFFLILRPHQKYSLFPVTCPIFEPFRHQELPAIAFNWMAPCAKYVQVLENAGLQFSFRQEYSFRQKKDSALSTTTDQGYLSTKVFVLCMQNGIKNFSKSPHTQAVADCIWTYTFLAMGVKIGRLLVLSFASGNLFQVRSLRSGTQTFPFTQWQLCWARIAYAKCKQKPLKFSGDTLFVNLEEQLRRPRRRPC